MTSTVERPLDAPLTLDQPAPRTLGLADQTGLWANLGVSILGFTYAIYVLNPFYDDRRLSLGAALTALVLGTILGSAAIAVAAIPGTVTGQPAMVLLRGLFGARLSWLPTVLNVVQLIGWTVFELFTISFAMHQVAGGIPKWVYVVIGGVLTTVFSLWPLGWIRVLRRYVTVLVVLALVWLGVELLRHPLPSLGHGSWSGFWIAVDTVVGAAVSWVPVAADYTRHSPSVRDTVLGSFIGYSVTQIACYGIGLLALVTVAQDDANKIFSSFEAIPLGTLAFAVLAIREVDQSFVDGYSTVVSLQNLRPRWDRRPLAVVIGVATTIAALAVDINSYQSFLLLIGGVFVPMLGVFAVDWFLISRGQWDLGERAPARWLMLVPWLAGFATYQLVNPGGIGWWARLWGDLRWFDVQSWMSASLLSLAVAALLTVPFGLLDRRLRADRVRGR